MNYGSYGAMRLDSVPTMMKALAAIIEGAKIPIYWSDARAWIEDDEDYLYLSVPVSMDNWAIMSAPLHGLTEADLRSPHLFGDALCPGPTFTEVIEGHA
jgi:hypothetical protein